MRKAYRRAYGPDGVEVEVDANTTKKVSTGFLSSSYKTVAVKPSDQLDPAAAKRALGTALAAVAAPAPSSPAATAPDVVEVWGEEDTLNAMDFQEGEEVRRPPVAAARQSGGAAD